MICGAIHGKTGAVCDRECPHPGQLHRLENCDARKTVEWGDDEIAVSPWNRPLEPLINKKAG